MTHEYRVMEWDSKGRGRRRNRSEVVAEHASGMAFGVRDSSGVIVVDPNGSRPDAPEKVLQSGRVQARPGSGHGNTIGYKYEEWVLRPGRQLYVLGEVVDHGGTLTMAKPTDGPYIVSTRNEEQLLAAETKKQRWFSIGAAAAGVAGAVVVAVSFFV